MASSVSFHAGLSLLIIAASGLLAPRERTEPPEHTIELAFEPSAAPTSAEAEPAGNPVAEQAAAPIAREAADPPVHHDADPLGERSAVMAEPPVAEAVPDPPPPLSPPAPPEPRQAAMEQPPEVRPPETPASSDLDPLPVPPRPRRLERPAAKPHLPAPRPVGRDSAPPNAGGSVNVSAEAGQTQAALAGVPAATAVATSTTDWRAALMAWLRGRTFYPDASRRQGLQGRVLVRFTVARDGAVRDAIIVQGSEHAVLNEAAMAMLRGARAPAFTAEMSGERLNVTVPITFSLSR
jgi:protein TonB